MREVAGLYLRLGDEIDIAVNRRVHALARAISENRPPGITEVVPCYTCVYVEFDKRLLTAAKVSAWARNLPQEASHGSGRTVRLGVHYDGIDLGAVAAATGLDEAEVVRRHGAIEYLVYAVGFTPGFPFMGTVDPLIRLPRLTSPRPNVAAGTVAIADAQTGIYSLPSPGGWRQLGTVRETIYDPQRERPTLLEAGDSVRFEPLSSSPAEDKVAHPLEPFRLLPSEPRLPRLQVHEPGLLDLVVDGGRFGAGHIGLARSGPLDALSAATANRLVGNPADAPLLEMNAKGPVMEVLGDCLVAFGGYGVRPLVDDSAVEPFTTLALKAGAVLRFPPAGHGARGYLAIAGGIESSTFMGSASVDVRGLIGKPLAAGDVLGTTTARSGRGGFSFEPHVRWPAIERAAQKQAGRFAALLPSDLSATLLRLLPGPQFEAAAMKALTSRQFRIQRADRMGLQLDTGTGTAEQGTHSAVVPGHGIISEPNPLGAVQITPGGQPLVLLHDRGTIGGYSKPAIVHPRDLAVAGQLRTGDAVRFTLAQ